MDFGTSIKTCFSKYVQFKGRASRSEFWWFYLFECIILMLPMFLYPFCFVPYVGWFFLILFLVLYPILCIAMAIPLWAVGFRRLHDTGNAGALWLINLVPFGWIYILCILCTKESVPTENEYGPVPVE